MMGLAMHKTFFPLAFFLSFLFSSFAFAEEPDFEGIDWGMGAFDVVQLKGSGIIDRGDDHISYWERVQEKKFRVDYYFEEGGLSQIEYHLSDKLKEGESYIDFMYLIHDVLSAKFGDSDDYKISMSADVDPDNLEQGVMDGKLRYIYWWHGATYTTQLKLGDFPPDGPPPLSFIVFKENGQET